MQNNAASWGLRWESILSDETVAGQRWVLHTMQKHGPALVTLLWRILGNESDVCDAYQDTFVQLAYYSQKQSPRKVRNFVFRTASNTAISILRRKKVHQNACEVLAQRPPRPASDPAADLDTQQLREFLRSGIARLPEQLRRVVVLKDLAEMPVPEVAETLGISQASVRVYRSRAIQLLSVWMARMDRNES